MHLPSAVPPSPPSHAHASASPPPVPPRDGALRARRATRPTWPRHGPLLPAAFALAVVGSACADPVSAPRVAGISRDVYCDPNAIAPADGCPGSGTNPGDTHVSADITVNTTAVVNTSTPFTDPVTGAQTTSFTTSADPVHLHADAGYTTSGAVTIASQFTDGPDPTHVAAPQTVTADLTADNLTEINSSNQQLTDTPPTELASDSPTNLVGSTQNGDVTAGVLVDRYDTLSTSNNRAAPVGAATGPAYNRAAGEVSLARAVTLAEGGAAQATRFNGVPVT